MIAIDLCPMQAKLVSDLPHDHAWQFEPRSEEFRAFVFRDGDDMEVMSKSARPPSRHFSEVVSIFHEVGCRKFTLDGELILPIGNVLSFDALQARLHPAASRIKRLSQETRTQTMLFDCLGSMAGVDGSAAG